jgi:hypothetical protein
MAAKPKEKSAAAHVLGTRIESDAPLLLFLDPETGADKLMDLIAEEKVTFAELPVDVVAWIRIPNEADDLHKKRAVSPEPGVAPFKQRERCAAHLRVS